LQFEQFFDVRKHRGMVRVDFSTGWIGELTAKDNW